jgi:hypothetical protein
MTWKNKKHIGRHGVNKELQVYINSCRLTLKNYVSERKTRTSSGCLAKIQSVLKGYKTLPLLIGLLP